MPIYEYQCQQCNKITEFLQNINAKPLTDCPQCQQPTLQRVVSATSFRLKGTGWYETDFKQTSKATPSSAPEKKIEDNHKTSDNKTITKTSEKSD